MLAAFAARSCDAPGAAIGTCEAGKERGLALSSFPCGAAPMKQVSATMLAFTGTTCVAMCNLQCSCGRDPRVYLAAADVSEHSRC